TFRTRAQSWRDYWRGGLSMTGGGQRVDGSNYECGYFPLALALPALVTRLVALDWHGQPRTGGVFLPSHAARLISLLLVDLALWWFLKSVPWAAFLLLGCFSIPMAIEQSVSVGHDGALMALALLLLSIFLTRDDWPSIGLALLVAILMTLEKPVF